jgi:hypothetical protein
LEVLDLNTSIITSSHLFRDAGGKLFDIIPLYDSCYLLAAQSGLLKTTKDHLIKRYFKYKKVISLCDITESIFLVGFQDDELTVWDEVKD